MARLNKGLRTPAAQKGRKSRKVTNPTGSTRKKSAKGKK